MVYRYSSSLFLQKISSIFSTIDCSIFAQFFYFLISFFFFFFFFNFCVILHRIFWSISCSIFSVIFLIKKYGMGNMIFQNGFNGEYCLKVIKYKTFLFYKIVSKTHQIQILEITFLEENQLITNCIYLVLTYTVRQ